MTFLHVAFLGGALAIAVPIVLHLMMRQQPKHLEFPALRFIKQREHANRRQVRLRHWLLLALRCARDRAVGAGAGAAEHRWPRACWAIRKRRWRRRWCSIPIRGCSIGSKTRPGSRSRRKRPQWLLPQLAAGERRGRGRLAQLGSAAFAVDLGAARQRIERLDASTMTQPLAAGAGSRRSSWCTRAKNRARKCTSSPICRAPPGRRRHARSSSANWPSCATSAST